MTEDEARVDERENIAAALRRFATTRLNEFGPYDARGAAIWDCAAWVTEKAGADDKPESEEA